MVAQKKEKQTMLQAKTTTLAVINTSFNPKLKFAFLFKINAPMQINIGRYFSGFLMDSIFASKTRESFFKVED